MISKKINVQFLVLLDKFPHQQKQGIWNEKRRTRNKIFRIS